MRLHECLLERCPPKPRACAFRGDAGARGDPGAVAPTHRRPVPSTRERIKALPNVATLEESGLKGFRGRGPARHLCAQGHAAGGCGSLQRHAARRAEGRDERPAHGGHGRRSRPATARRRTDRQAVVAGPGRRARQRWLRRAGPQRAGLIEALYAAAAPGIPKRLGGSMRVKVAGYYSLPLSGKAGRKRVLHLKRRRR